MDKQSAQQRADQVRAFQAELKQLQAEDVLHLPDEAQARVRDYHDALLGSFATQFDVDTSHEQKRLSWGMRIASFLGALAISAESLSPVLHESSENTGQLGVARILLG